MSTFLIAGGAGFLGFHLCRRLLGDGHQVICLDNFVTGLRENVEALSGSSNFRCIEHNVCAPVNCNEKIDKIINLACPASPQHYQGKRALFTMQTCFNGAVNLLELAVKHGASFLQASTSEVYGDPVEHPQKETYRGNVNSVGIRACYDEGKRIAESLCFEYRRNFEVDTKIIRIFNTYGPKMDPRDGRVVSNFICQAVRGEDITIFGDGSQTRSFCYVSDLIDAMILTVQTSKDFGGPVNLGNPNEFSVLELAEMIIRKTGGRSKLIFMPLPADDPSRRCPDINLARTRLGWNPKVKLNEGLDMTIAYFSSLLGNGGTQ